MLINASSGLSSDLSWNRWIRWVSRKYYKLCVVYFFSISLSLSKVKCISVFDFLIILSQTLLWMYIRKGFLCKTELYVLQFSGKIVVRYWYNIYYSPNIIGHNIMFLDYIRGFLLICKGTLYCLEFFNRH